MLNSQVKKSTGLSRKQNYLINKALTSRVTWKEGVVFLMSLIVSCWRKIKHFLNRLVALEEQHRREKQESDQLFAEVRKEYEAKIDTLQKQVMEQSMMSSMYSSIMTTDRDFEEFADTCLWSVEEYRVARLVCDKWRTHQFTSLRVRKSVTFNTIILFSLYFCIRRINCGEIWCF